MNRQRRGALEWGRAAEGNGMAVCPVVKYVPHHEVERYLRLGWMEVADLLVPHGHYVALMGWPCDCPLPPLGETSENESRQV
jgi:hypothetical protein